MTSNQRINILAAFIITVLLVVAYKVFAATQALDPDGNGAAVADGGTGRWTTYGSGSSAWGRISDENYANGVTEGTVNDSCNFNFATFTFPAGAIISQVQFTASACLSAGSSVTVRMDICDGTNCSNGTATSLSPPEVPPDCDGTTLLIETRTLAPDGGAWTQTDIDNMQVRLVLTAQSGSGTARAPEIDAVVTYTVPSSGGRRIKLLKAFN